MKPFERLVVIDAGGSSTRAWGVDGGRVVFEGQGGCGSPRLLRLDPLSANWQAALDGAPSTDYVVAGVSGAGTVETREPVLRILDRLFPEATKLVVADHALALRAAPAPAKVCVLAGTGSIVCSRQDGGISTSGGAGWLVGDPGSAVSIGRALLGRLLTQDQLDPRALDELAATYGSREPARIREMLYAADDPWVLLGLAARIADRLCVAGVPWAAEMVQREMRDLATVTYRHLTSRFRGSVAVALWGGVWNSAFARQAFSEELARMRNDVQVIGPKADGPPWDLVRAAQALLGEMAGR